MSFCKFCFSKFSLAAALVVVAAFTFCQSANAQSQPRLSNSAEPNWYPYVIARGADRAKIQNTPMELRPYRPMHFYGNTVRRTYYRGTPAPAPIDLFRGSAAIIRRR